MNKTIKVEEHIKDIIRVCWEAIKLKRVLRFPFESKNGKTGSREIKPYMVYINKGKEIRVVGLPRELWDETMDKKRQPGHYLLLKIDLQQLNIREETFTDPGVSIDKVISSKTVEIICRFIYDDEDKQEAMKNWIKVVDLDLS